MHRASRRWAVDAASVVWLLALAGALLAPVLAHGGVSGPLDVLSKYGLNASSTTTVHNPSTQDLASEIIPWMTLAWTQVHAGHLPLWNSASALGMPLAFNWQSAVFALPSLVGYLVPLRYDPTVQMLVTLVVAGTGVYAFCRVMGLRVLACVFAATAFELSGPVVSWLGWPVASVASWTGWVCAAAVLIGRGRHRAWSVALFAFALAEMVLAGQLDMLIVTVACLAVFFGLIGLQRYVRSGCAVRSGRVVRPAIDLGIASLCGVALAAPLALPGAQLVRSSVRSDRSTNAALAAHDWTHLLFAGFDGSTVHGHQWFGDPLGFYPDSAALVGVIVFALVVVAVVTRFRSTVVRSLTGMAAVALVLAFVPVAVTAAKSIPFLGPVQWSRAIVLVAFMLTVLSGFGLDAVLHRTRDRSAPVAGVVGFAAAGLVLLVTWVVGRGHLPPSEASARAQSFAWPVAQCVVGLVLMGWLLTRSHTSASPPRFDRRRVVALLLIGVEAAFLVTAGSAFATPARQLHPSTPAVTELRRIVGSSLIGIGAGSCLPFGGPIAVGILPEANDLYGIHEFSLYDPSVPERYYSSWALVTGAHSVIQPPASVFCPTITTVREARIYGIRYVLEPSGAPGPAGSQFVATLGDEDLYRIPGASPATLTASSDPSAYPPLDSPGRPVPVVQPSPGDWVVRTDSPGAEVLRLRITDVPGLRATIDGHPLTLEPYADVMVQARIPPGAHTIHVSYRPGLFTVGEVLAALTLAGLVGAVVWTELRRRSAKS